MPAKKGGVKKNIAKVKKKSAGVKTTEPLKEIILHEEWPQTEKLIKAQEKRGVILDPDRELVAKPEFSELSKQVSIEPAVTQAWWVPSISVFFRLSGWLLIPLILGTTLGKWLDRKYDTAPWLFLATIGFAFLVSMYGLIKNTMEEFKRIENTADKNNGTNSFEKNK